MTSKKRPLGAHNPMVVDLLHRMQGKNSFLVVATTALFSTGFEEKAHMVAHLGQAPPPGFCSAEVINEVIRLRN